MSTKWSEKAKLNAAKSKAQSKIGEASHPELNKKAGRKKSIVERKNVMLSLSEYQTKQIANLELLLKINDIDIKRGRSETVELAIAYLTRQMKDPETVKNTASWIGGVVGMEEKLAEEQKEI